MSSYNLFKNKIVKLEFEKGVNQLMASRLIGKGYGGTFVEIWGIQKIRWL